MMKNALWINKHPHSTRMWSFMHYLETKHQIKFKEYHELHHWSVTEPALFWQSLCDFFAIQFNQPAQNVLNEYEHMMDARWFEGAKLNFAKQLLSRNDDHPAIISVDERRRHRTLSYAQLRTEVAHCAAGLIQAGVEIGDRIAAIMPNVAETIIAMLACSSIGAIWSSCSPDFGAKALIDRLEQLKPKVIFVCDGYQYQGKNYAMAEKIIEVVETISSIQSVVVTAFSSTPIDLHTVRGGVTWDAFLKPSTGLKFTSLPFAHPLYILFSSGTTGNPKCIIHGAGGTLLQHIKELGLHTDLNANDKMLFYTTCGWMMWNWMVSALALGTTLVLYDGSPTYPDGNRLFQLIEDEHITVFGTSAKFLSVIEQSGIKPSNTYSLRSLRSILSTASPLLPKNFDFVYQSIKSDVQLSSISGGTDIISCFALGNPIKPVYAGELQSFGLGMDVQVFNQDGQAVLQERGELVCTKPFPSMPIGFWQDTDKKNYRNAYFSRFTNVWTQGDFAEITEHKGLIIYGRSDTLLKSGGIRIGTAEIYRQLSPITEITDSVVIGQNWNDDTRIVLFIKLQEGLSLNNQLISKIRTTIRQHASPRHVPAKILQVADIPRTLNGKVVETAVRQIVHGESINNRDSIMNPEALDYFKNRVELNED